MTIGRERWSIIRYHNDVRHVTMVDGKLIRGEPIFFCFSVLMSEPQFPWPHTPQWGSDIAIISLKDCTVAHHFQSAEVLRCLPQTRTYRSPRSQTRRFIVFHLKNDSPRLNIQFYRSHPAFRIHFWFYCTTSGDVFQEFTTPENLQIIFATRKQRWSHCMLKITNGNFMLFMNYFSIL